MDPKLLNLLIVLCGVAVYAGASYLPVDAAFLHQVGVGLICWAGLLPVGARKATP